MRDAGQQAIRSNPSYVVPRDYVERFWKAVVSPTRAHVRVRLHCLGSVFFRTEAADPCPHRSSLSALPSSFFPHQATFKHARAYDPRSKTIVCLSPLPATMDLASTAPSFTDRLPRLLRCNS